MLMTNLRTESDAYRSARDGLRAAELELMEHAERVAAQRRALPPGPLVDDYELIEVPSGRTAALSSLCTGPDRTLVVYHYMLGKAQTAPCPMCTMWIDGFDAVAPHLAQRIDFAVVAADADLLESIASERRWSNARLFSAGESSFKRDLGSEHDDGTQESAISVFRLDGTDVRHTYTGKPVFDPETYRGIDLLTPVWNVLDLTPEGRGDWFPSVSY